MRKEFKNLFWFWGLDFRNHHFIHEYVAMNIRHQFHYLVCYISMTNLKNPFMGHKSNDHFFLRTREAA